jgi:hypothetical protein
MLAISIDEDRRSESVEQSKLRSLGESLINGKHRIAVIPRPAECIDEWLANKVNGNQSPGHEPTSVNAAGEVSSSPLVMSQPA